ncbi:cation diffusion facilitator family transporter [Aedoeadaptatus coxii]|uniref:cation diffusion facilitator family transporter n=1 Tax=Aedoeadaptatus coxii TaxID=755172 RepID=UPI002AD4CAA3|nr:cation diffusion facilitator family transporter [Peptoniphilus coxii]
MNRDKILLNNDDREGVIIKTSVIGVITNVLLAAFKAVVGVAAHSIAITLDAVNNLADALSSVITIVGAKLGVKSPDKKHPMGYGRIEYISSLIVAAIVLYAGITALVESVKNIMNPQVPSYGKITLAVVAVGIVVKLILGKYVKSRGEKVGSVALVASGSEASFDAILSASVLVSAIVYLLWGIATEAYVGALIAVFIVKAGIDMMSETLSDIIGKRTDPKIARRIKEILDKEKEVRGTYDVVLFNYGPEKYYGSAHIELPDTLEVEEVDALTRRAQYEIYKETGVIMTGIGVYSYNTKDKEAVAMREAIEEKIMSYPWVLQFHGFYLDREKKTIRFDVVANFGTTNGEALDRIYNDIGEMYPGYTLRTVIDRDMAG